ncbi:hypothetical protein LOD99_14449 [Oopsacas minuta]|uniref:PHD-type domain-containing protein n=1 Tax=Oopsacas minuta TaxID=111878 RepID=A0AAV7KHD6_9METZ|nr:hypothetical protein LOD99_14449 [Oopsacas minuta]
MHQFCPEGESSWCHYRRAKFLGDPIPSHPTALSQSCKDRLIEILGPYMTLSFLDKVKAGRTSNLNESLHNVIWSFIPKTRAIDLDLMHFGSSLAVIKYNDGFAGITDLVRELGLQPSQSFIRFCSSSDNDRIDFSKLKKGKEYTKRRWSIKQSKRRRKRLGDGYKSGAYSHVSVSSDVCCMLCGGDENSGAKSNSKKVAKIDVFDWTCCDVCNSWFHNFCLNNIYGSVLCVNAEELWICPTCQRS